MFFRSLFCFEIIYNCVLAGSQKVQDIFPILQ